MCQTVAMISLQIADLVQRAENLLCDWFGGAGLCSENIKPQLSEDSKFRLMEVQLDKTVINSSNLHRVCALADISLTHIQVHLQK